MGDAPIVRVIGSDDVDANLDGLRVWIPTVVEWLADGRTPYVFAHQPENRRSPDLARSFHEAVRARVPALAPLTEPSVVTEAGETSGQVPLF